jgi:hypothetical protein
LVMIFVINMMFVMILRTFFMALLFASFSFHSCLSLRSISRFCSR